MTRRTTPLALALTACVAAAPAASPTSKPAGGGDLVSIGNDLVRFVAPPPGAWTVHPSKDATADVVVFVNAKADAEIQYILAAPDFRISPDVTGQMAVGMCKSLKEKHERDHITVVMPPTVEHDRRLDIVIHEKFLVGQGKGAGDRGRDAPVPLGRPADADGDRRQRRPRPRRRDRRVQRRQGIAGVGEVQPVGEAETEALSSGGAVAPRGHAPPVGKSPLRRDRCAALERLGHTARIAAMIPILSLADVADRAQVESLLSALRLDVSQLTAGGRFAAEAESVRQTIADVAARGDAALVDAARKFDHADFTADMLRVWPDKMAAAAARVSGRSDVGGATVDRAGARVPGAHPTRAAPRRCGGRASSWASASRRSTRPASTSPAARRRTRRA